MIDDGAIPAIRLLRRGLSGLWLIYLLGTRL